MSLLCMLMGHRIDRNAVSHDGQDYWSSCKRCGAFMIRGADRWRVPKGDEIADHESYLDQRSDYRKQAGLD